MNHFMLMINIHEKEGVDVYTKEIIKRVKGKYFALSPQSRTSDKSGDQRQEHMPGDRKWARIPFPPSHNHQNELNESRNLPLHLLHLKERVSFKRLYSFKTYSDDRHWLTLDTTDIKQKVLMSSLERE